MKNEAFFPTRTTCPKAAARFADPALLFESLKNLDPCAIRYLHSKTIGFLSKGKSRASAHSLDIEELANDAVVLTLKKIGEGKCLFQGFSPVTYGLTVAENLLKNFARRKRLASQSLEDGDWAVEADIEAYLCHKETELQIGKMLARLDENCRQLIRLKYFDGLGDAEVVAGRLALYSTVDSLKNKRCACMKKLAQVLRNFAPD